MPALPGAISKVPYGEPTWLTKGYRSPYFKETHYKFQKGPSLVVPLLRLLNLGHSCPRIRRYLRLAGCPCVRGIGQARKQGRPGPSRVRLLHRDRQLTLAVNSTCTPCASARASTCTAGSSWAVSSRVKSLTTFSACSPRSGNAHVPAN